MFVPLGITIITIATCVTGTSSAVANNIPNDNTLNKKLNAMTLNKQFIAEGKTLFQNSCASCHGKKLEGGTGFNLVDGQWIHSNSPSGIHNSISNGFMNAGMPAFKHVYNKAQINKIVAYVLSKRQGWENLTYKLYATKENIAFNFTNLNNQKPIKKGTLPNNLADFAIPEIKNYTIQFEGDFYSPWKDPVNIWFKAPKKLQLQLQLQIKIDGKVVTDTSKVWQPTFALKQGKQKLQITYTTAGTPKWLNKDLTVMVVNKDASMKMFPISTAGSRFLKKNTFDIIADKQPQVIRRKIVNLPFASIAVGLPNKINYAFNSKNCAIVGVWKGDLLNIGPNIGGRGQDPSLPLGDWLFHHPKAITIDTNNTQVSSCKLNKYTRQGTPVFYFTKDKTQYSISGQAINKGIRFEYKILSSNKLGKTLHLQLPSSKEFTITSDKGSVKNGSLIIPTKNLNNFNVSLSKN